MEDWDSPILLTVNEEVTGDVEELFVEGESRLQIRGNKELMVHKWKETKMQLELGSGKPREEVRSRYERNQLG